MKLVVFGVSISSSWGHGHATLWRGLCRALHAMGHDIVFYERDLPSHASNRDLIDPPYCELVLYEDFRSIRDRAAADVATAGAAVVTSYSPDAIAASELVVASRCKARLFYATTRAHELTSILAEIRGTELIAEKRPQGNIVATREA